MTPAELLTELARLGITLAAEGNGIRVRPASRLPGTLRCEVLARKAELLDLLRQREADRLVCRAIETDLGLPAGSLELWAPVRRGGTR
jgi:hypothetical protein